jgi:hypothetical protein
MNGGWDSGTWDDATWDFVPTVVVDDTHDGKRFKKRLDRELAAKQKRRLDLINAYEMVVEGRPTDAEKIIKPFLQQEKPKQIATINFDGLLNDLKRVEQIYLLRAEIDDEEVIMRLI